MTPKKIASFAIGPIGGALLGFITLPIITWFFTQEDVGRLSMLTIAVSFSTLLFPLGLDQAYVREFHESGNKPKLFKTVVMPGLILLTLVLIVLLMLDNQIAKKLFNINSLTLSLLVALALLSDFLSRFFSLILRMNEKGLAFSLSQLLPKILLFLIIGGYIIFDVAKDFYHLATAIVISSLSVCIIFSWNTREDWINGLKDKISMEYLIQLLNFGFPLILGGVAFWGLTATDKILLKELSSFDEVGLYSVSVSFAAAAAIFQSVFSTVWAPTVYKWAASGEGLENIHKVTRFVLLIVVFLFSLGALFSWLVVYILPDNYNQVQWILIPCLAYPLFYTLSETTVVGLGITRRSGLSLLAACLAFLVNLIGNWLLIPVWGAKGAAISTSIAFWLFFLLRTEFAVYAWKPIPRFSLYSYTFIVLSLAIFSCLQGYMTPELHYIFWTVVVFSLPFFFKEECFLIKQWLKVNNIF
ncbi:oligosaccharide flippase family protein [Vibrio metschnikovii]|uniref:lipopolysaccharide biosynthesis protein n=1 Tax=Vibrio metschnikovii TaxID=28172 RepID=UPI002FCA5441|nr:oligosaccharide flippase family protein [Vibrio metschnikovii]